MFRCLSSSSPGSAWAPRCCCRSRCGASSSPRSGRSGRWLALFAVVEIILPWFALSEAERGISSSLTGLLVASVPIIVAVLSLFLRGGDRLSPIRWTGLLIGLGGVALLAGPNLIGSGATSGTARSVAEVLFVALCYATGPLIANRKLTDVPPVAMTAACLALASVVYAPLAALNWPSAVPAGQGTARARGAGRDLHGGGVPDLLPADRRGRAGQGQRDYLHQPGDRRIARRGRARRACDAVMLAAFVTSWPVPCWRPGRRVVRRSRPEVPDLRRRSPSRSGRRPTRRDHGRFQSVLHRAAVLRIIRDHESSASAAPLDSRR